MELFNLDLFSNWIFRGCGKFHFEGTAYSTIDKRF